MRACLARHLENKANRLDEWYRITQWPPFWTCLHCLLCLLLMVKKKLELRRRLFLHVWNCWAAHGYKQPEECAQKAGYSSYCNVQNDISAVKLSLLQGDRDSLTLWICFKEHNKWARGVCWGLVEPVHIKIEFKNRYNYNLLVQVLLVFKFHFLFGLWQVDHFRCLIGCTSSLVAFLSFTLSVHEILDSCHRILWKGQHVFPVPLCVFFLPHSKNIGISELALDVQKDCRPLQQTGELLG